MDNGSVERNADMHRIALQRAAERNGGQHIPASNPSSVIADDFPSQAVDVPRRRTGSNEGGE